MLATFLALFVGWLIIIAPLRNLAKMPTMKEELGVGIKDGRSKVLSEIRRIYREQNDKNEEMYRAQEYTQEMRQRARLTGLGLLVAGVILSLGGVWSLVAVTFETGALLDVQLMMLIIGPAMAIGGLIQVITGQSIIRKRDK